jgi:hypothetical protein
MMKMRQRIIVIVLAVLAVRPAAAQDKKLWYEGYWIGGAYKAAWDTRMPLDTVYRAFPKLVYINSKGVCSFINGEKGSSRSGMPVKKDTGILVYRNFSLQANSAGIVYKNNIFSRQLVSYDRQKDGLYNISGYPDYFFWQGRTKWSMDVVETDSTKATVSIIIDNPYFKSDDNKKLWTYICNGNLQKNDAGEKLYGISFVFTESGKARNEYYLVRLEKGRVYIMNKQGKLKYLLY